MRILHIESGMDSGGQEHRTTNEVSWLLANGHEAWIACNEESEVFGAAPKRGARVVPLRMRGTWDYPATLKLLRLCRKLRCDIIHTHSPIDSWIAAPLKFAGIPVMRTRHIANPVRKGFFRTFTYRHGCDHLIATAVCIRDALMRDNGIPPEHISVVGEGVDITEFQRERDGAAFREMWGIEPGDVVVGCIGMLRPEKGQKQFIQAAALAREQIPEARFIIIGDHKCGASPFRDRYRKLAQKRFGYDPWLPGNALKASTERPLLMHGMADDSAGATAAVDIAVIPSLAEAQTRTAPEALCMAKAVIASEVGGLPEVVDHGRNGLLVPPGDVDALAEAMVLLVRDSALRRRLGEAAHADSRSRFGMDAKMNETLVLYNRVLKKEE